MNIIKTYKDTKSKECREWFLLGLFSAVGILMMIFLTFIFEEGTQDYYHANNGLFIGIILNCLLLLGGKEKTKVILHKVNKVFKRSLDLNLYDYGDILLLCTYILAIVSFIFILDLSFIENYGVRISAVVGITIAKLLKDLVWSRIK